MIDLSSARLKPFDHQRVGVEKLVEQPVFFLADEQGAGKTKQVIDAAQVLFDLNIIDRVLIVCPASVRGVWFDPELGEIRKHLWEKTYARVCEYHVKVREWFTPGSGRRLEFWITNYEFTRGRVAELKLVCGKRTLLVLDESSAVKNYRAAQTKACLQLRKYCGRVVLLNGTPIENSVGDLYSQARILDPKILDCDTYFHFRARYGQMGGWMNRQVVKWVNVEDIQTRLAPYVLRRLKKDCLDLPDKLPPVTLTCALDERSWALYKEMRDEMVAWLTSSTVATSAQAGVKGLRLAQLTSGFLGGIQHLEGDDLDLVTDLMGGDELESDNRPEWLPYGKPELPAEMEIGKPIGGKTVTPKFVVGEAQELNRVKLDLFHEWLKGQLELDPSLKLLVWCRFRPELFRLQNELTQYPWVSVAGIYGGQKRADRDRAIRLLDPRTAPKSPAIVLGTLGSGARGLNLTACHTVIYLSNDFRYGTYVQSIDRVHRPGQTSPVSYFDVVATGPQGQKTIDHQILRARANKQNMADMTTSAWVQALMDE